ncbi:MAG: DUF3598 family protein [Phormidesmis sp.]
MKSQWSCIQQNIGTWHGSFTQFSPEGQQLKDTPSVLTLEETEPGKRMQLTLERTPEGGTPDIVRREFSYPGPAPYVYFFESGAFSQGSAQWTAFAQFGAEMSIKVGDRRTRFVVMYDANSNGTSSLKYVTLICETRGEETTFEEPLLRTKQLIEYFKGEVSVLHADMSPMSQGYSEWLAGATGDGKVVLDNQENGEKQGSFARSLSLSSDSPIELPFSSTKSIFLLGEIMYQLMPLPNGAYCLLPQTIEKEIAFRIEVGWLRKGGARSRLIRYYDNRGVWTDSALIADRLAS